MRLRLAKMASVFVAIALVALVGCATSRPRLDETQALRIGMSYATLMGWEVTNTFGGANYRNTMGEWQMFFQLKQGGSPYVVFVNDKTKQVRSERGQ